MQCFHHIPTITIRWANLCWRLWSHSSKHLLICFDIFWQMFHLFHLAASPCIVKIQMCINVVKLKLKPSWKEVTDHQQRINNYLHKLSTVHSISAMTRIVWSCIIRKIQKQIDAVYHLSICRRYNVTWWTLSQKYSYSYIRAKMQCMHQS